MEVKISFNAPIYDAIASLPSNARDLGPCPKQQYWQKPRSLAPLGMTVQNAQDDGAGCSG